MPLRFYPTFIIVAMMSGFSGLIIGKNEANGNDQIFLACLALSILAWAMAGLATALVRSSNFNYLPVFCAGLVCAFALLSGAVIMTFGLNSEITIASLLMAGTGWVIGILIGIKLSLEEN